MDFKLVMNKRVTIQGMFRYDAWLLMDGKAVSYLDLLDRPDYNGLVCACTVETREGYERQGLSKKIMEMASAELGKPLGCSGGFTPEGFIAYSGKLPLIPSGVKSDKPSYRSMKFVNDWDNLYGA
jgi:hypothetical protein